MDENIRKLLKEKYDILMKKYLEQSKKYSELSKDSRERNRGSFGYLDERPDLKFGRFANMQLGSALASIYLIIENKEDRKGLCRKFCINCLTLRYNSSENRWYCQEECECK